MNIKKIKVWAIVGILACAMSSAVYARWVDGKKDLRIVGRVVAYDQLISLMQITTSSLMEVLIVRVDKRIQGVEKSPYVQVKFRALGDDKGLPPGVFDSKKRWRFTLVRDSTCDASFRTLQNTTDKPDENEISLPHFKPTTGSELDAIPLDKMLPCYLLQPGSLRPE